MSNEHAPADRRKVGPGERKTNPLRGDSRVSQGSRTHEGSRGLYYSGNTPGIIATRQQRDREAFAQEWLQIPPQSYRDGGEPQPEDPAR